MTSPTKGTLNPSTPTPVQHLVAPQFAPTGKLRRADQAPLVAKQTRPEVARVESTTVAAIQIAAIHGAAEPPGLGGRSVSAAENPQSARAGNSRMPAPRKSPPPRPDAAARKELQLKEQYARDDALLDAILKLRDLSRGNPDFKQPDRFMALSMELLQHTFSIARISSNHMAKLLVAFAELPNLGAGELPDQIEHALTQRLQHMGPGELTELAAALAPVRLDDATRTAMVMRGNRLMTDSLVAAMAGALQGSAVKVSAAIEDARNLCVAVVPYDSPGSLQGNFDDVALVQRLGGMLKSNSPQIVPLREAFRGKKLEGRAGGKAEMVTKKTELSKAYARWQLGSSSAEKRQTENVKLARAVFEEAHTQFVQAVESRSASAKITVTGHERKIP